MYHNLDKCKKYCPTNAEYNRLYYDSDLFKFMDSHKTESRSNVTHVSPVSYTHLRAHETR